MEGLNTDLRIIKTRSALAGALLDLLDKNSFDQIKVVDICDKARVHRTTFYKHFEDKYHLLNYVVNEIISELMENISPVADFDTPEEFYTSLLKAIITYIHNNRRKFKLIIKNNMSGIFMHTMQNIISAHILEYLKEFSKKGYDFGLPLPLMAHYRSGGMISVAYYLLENNTTYNIDEIYAYMLHLFYDPPYSGNKKNI